MNILMFSCKKATELIEKRLVTRLSSIEKIQLKMHTVMCKRCTSYEKQSEIIEKSLKDIHQHKGKSLKLPAEKKEELLKYFNKN